MHQEEHQGVTLWPLGRASLAETVNTVSLVFVSCGCNQYLSCVCFCLYMCLQLARSLSLSLSLSLSEPSKPPKKFSDPKSPKPFNMWYHCHCYYHSHCYYMLIPLSSMFIIVLNILKKIASKKLHPRSDDRMDPKGSLLHKDTRSKLLQQKEKSKEDKQKHWRPPCNKLQDSYALVSKMKTK